MKKHAAVIAAEQLATAKKDELATAEELVRRLREEWGQAMRNVHAVQVGLDAKLPQCTMVTVTRYSQKETASGRVVLLRKTPGGMLVVRRVGDSSETAIKFKWRDHSAQYVQADKIRAYSDWHALRDVPPEFLPSPKQ